MGTLPTLPTPASEDYWLTEARATNDLVLVYTIARDRAIVAAYAADHSLVRFPR